MDASGSPDHGESGIGEQGTNIGEKEPIFKPQASLLKGSGIWNPRSGMWWSMVWEQFLDLLFPKPASCCLCLAAVSSPRDVVCHECRSGFTMVRQPVCAWCGRELRQPEKGVADRVCGDCSVHPRPFVMARAYGRYESILQFALQQMKYREDRRLSTLFAQYLTEVWLADLAGHLIDACISVPMHPKRLRDRGFNQAELLARDFSRNAGLPYWDALERVREGKSAVTKGKEARITSLQGAFRVRRESVAQVTGRTLLLVDDVFTTGATAESCTQALMDAGATAVYVLVVAR